VARGFKRLAITGTRWLIDSEVYPDALAALGLAYIRPTPEERDEINRIIMEELVCGVFKAEAVAHFQRVYARMKDAGCDAVVLGCTEIPLIMNDANSPLPTLASTRLLARAALRRAVARRLYGKPPLSSKHWSNMATRREVYSTQLKLQIH
jgi:aspartate racemase